MHISEKGLALIRQAEGLRLLAYKCRAFLFPLLAGDHRSAYPGRLRLAVFLALLDAFQFERLHLLIDRGVGAVQVCGNLRYQCDPGPLAKVGFFGCCPWFCGHFANLSQSE